MLLAALLLAGCGSKKADPNLPILDAFPVYPGAATARTTTTEAFTARDWTLPSQADSQTVVRWYERRLQAHGWKIVGESFGTLRATRRGASVAIGVRGRTLEAVANSTGG